MLRLLREIRRNAQLKVAYCRFNEPDDGRPLGSGRPRRGASPYAEITNFHRGLSCTYPALHPDLDRAQATLRRLQTKAILGPYRLRLITNGEYDPACPHCGDGTHATQDHILWECASTPLRRHSCLPPRRMNGTNTRPVQEKQRSWPSSRELKRSPSACCHPGLAPAPTNPFHFVAIKL